MLDSLAEIGDLAGVGPAGLDVSLLPVDVGDLIADIIADDIVALDLLLSQMGIIDTEENDATLCGGFNDDAEVELGHWDQTVVVAIASQVERRLLTILVGQCGDTIDTRVAVHSHLVLGHPSA